MFTLMIAMLKVTQPTIEESRFKPFSQFHLHQAASHPTHLEQSSPLQMSVLQGKGHRDSWDIIESLSILEAETWVALSAIVPQMYTVGHIQCTCRHGVQSSLQKWTAAPVAGRTTSGQSCQLFRDCFSCQESPHTKSWPFLRQSMLDDCWLWEYKSVGIPLSRSSSDRPSQLQGSSWVCVHEGWLRLSAGLHGNWTSLSNPLCFPSPPQEWIPIFCRWNSSSESASWETQVETVLDL